MNVINESQKLGVNIKDGKTTFRLFSLNAIKVDLIIFNKVNDTDGIITEMSKDNNGIWETIVDKDLRNNLYGYYVYFDKHINEKIKPPLSIDPYAKAVATYLDYFNPRKSIIYDHEYDWENDECIQRDWRDLIIYEMHIKDLTAHPSSQSKNPGTYKGVIEKNQIGGIDYIKSLCVNAVEILPVHEFGYFEAPYNKEVNGIKNNWNPYEINHWGYMTSNYFSPCAYYTCNNLKPNKHTWIGENGEQVNQFKDLVKEFHKEGISVIMDVVFNHLSEYELGNLKEIDKDYYFRLDNEGQFKSESYCGNDLKTENPMVRKLIVDSILFWMKEYHIDGFRFDLGKLIDWETIEAIIHEARKINPHIILICEPWGGGYDPIGFSLREWGSWNDQIRNGIKGENPKNGLGWIFGKWFGNNNPQRIQSYVRGTQISDEYGLFQKPEHSVNFLEAHDGYTLGDFIRLGLDSINGNKKAIDSNIIIKLSNQELKLNKLAALFLFTSKGITMIHQGQEFARSKVIESQEDVIDESSGLYDHNSYNKDNETNYINYNHAKINSNLLSYYKGLIKLRNKHEVFKKADFNDYKFISNKSKKFTLIYTVFYKNSEYFVAFNANPKSILNINLPDGWWNILADENSAMQRKTKLLKGNIKLESSTGIVLQKKD